MIFNKILISLLAAIPLYNAATVPSAVTREPDFELISEAFEAGQMVTNPDISIGATATSAAEKREHAECWNNSKHSLKEPNGSYSISASGNHLLSAQRLGALLLENSPSVFRSERLLNQDGLH
ncbi:hypothetical protein BDP55DRAFT_664991 [Colletotrichum godetiae]|uniref:Uncharacterized protein n=1 Tax=Colletotrichum godetiae TaxID=1209918 RepID=A0AAJ0AMT8_9PEZI|nr:uncharacterized protein BDP55DRAFT_664991 [Colletotrichum godetiae]KAK1675257.1 hypothetical protein BDP55DRAFT_664991 [Colletotrichum godetiae]